MPYDWDQGKRSHILSSYVLMLNKLQCRTEVMKYRSYEMTVVMN